MWAQDAALPDELYGELELVNHERARGLAWSRSCGRALAALALALLLGTITPLQVSITGAQADGQSTEETTEFASTEQPVVEEPQAEPEPPAPEEEQVPGEPPAEEPPTEGEPPVVDTETPESGGPVGQPAEEDQLPGAIEPPAAPTLTYIPGSQPHCAPSAGQPALLEHAAYMDFECRFTLSLAGERLAPADVQLEWTIQAAVDGGWNVQLMPPPAHESDVPAWTDPSPITGFGQTRSIWPSPSTEVVEQLDASSELVFGLRIHRAVCSEESQSVQLDIAVYPSVPAISEAQIEQLGPQPVTFQLAPSLASIPEPTVSFAGPLDFGQVRVNSQGLVSEPAPARSVLTVDGLDRTCGEYRLVLSSSAFADPSSGEFPDVGLRLVSVDDLELPEGTCDIAQGCDIAILAAGPAAEPSLTLTLGISLTLSNQPRAAVLGAALTAELVRLAPDSSVAAASEVEHGSG